MIQTALSLTVRYGDLAQAGGIEPPFGLCYLAAVLRRNHYDVSIIDAQALCIENDEIVKEVLRLKPDVVGITATTPAIVVAYQLSKKIKEKRSNTIIIIGGCHISALPEETMQQFDDFDIGIVGEAEATIIPLMDEIDHAIRRNQLEDLHFNLKKIDGLVLRNNNKEIVRTNSARTIDHLDDIPFPAFDLLPSLAKHYRIPTQSVNRLPAISLITSRGCTGRCTFCDLTITGRKPRAHSAEYTFELMRWVNKEFGIRTVMFEDDNFLVFHKRLKKLGDYLRKEKLDLSWSCTARVDMVNMEILTLAKSLGCWQILYGLETGSQMILDFYSKKITIHKIKKTINDTRKAGLKSKAFLMMGNPLETIESLEATIELVTSIPLDDISITFFTPYPGSPIYNMGVEQYGHFDQDWSKMSSFDIVFVPTGLNEKDLIKYQKKAYRKFYLRWSVLYDYLKRIDSMTQLKELLWSGIFLMQYAFLEYKHEAADRKCR